MSFEGETVLTEKQRSALAQLWDRLADIKTPDWDDRYLLKWLRARQFDVKKTEKMLRDHMEWRRQNQVDQILDWEVPEVLRLYYPGGYCGEDREGYPVWIDTMGTVDTKGLMFSATKKDIVKYKAFTLETLYRKTFPALSEKHGKLIDRVVVIFDMENYGRKLLWRPVVDVFSALMSMMADNYPELLKTAYFINTPKLFPVMWTIAKPFLDPDTIKKIKFLGKNWRTRLLEDIDPDQLPVHWGGTLRDPDGDECCRSKVCMGGKVPDNYRVNNVRDIFDMTQMKQCTVQRASTLHLEFVVPQPGSCLRWQFLSDGSDIGFGVYRRTADSRQKKADMAEVVRSERYNSHMVPEEGVVTLDMAGTYVARFDNSHSWMKSRKIDYTIEVLSPDHDSNGGLEHLGNGVDPTF